MMLRGNICFAENYKKILPWQYGFAALKLRGNSWEILLSGGMRAPNPSAGNNLSLSQREHQVNSYNYNQICIYSSNRPPD